MPKKVPKKTAVRKSRKKSSPSKLQTFLAALYQSRFTWFAAGVLLTAPLCPFVKGESAVMFLLKNLPVIQTVIQRTADSPKQIAAQAPKDKTKRQQLAAAFRSAAMKIQDKTLTTKDDVLSALTAETANVLSSANWKPVVFRVNQLLAAEDSLDSLAERLDEFAAAFE